MGNKHESIQSGIHDDHPTRECFVFRCSVCFYLCSCGCKIMCVCVYVVCLCVRVWRRSVTSLEWSTPSVRTSRETSSTPMTWPTWPKSWTTEGRCTLKCYPFTHIEYSPQPTMYLWWYFGILFYMYDILSKCMIVFLRFISPWGCSGIALSPTAVFILLHYSKTQHPLQFTRSTVLLCVHVTLRIYIIHPVTWFMKTWLINQVGFKKKTSLTWFALLRILHCCAFPRCCRTYKFVGGWLVRCGWTVFRVRAQHTVRSHRNTQSGESPVNHQ